MYLCLQGDRGNPGPEGLAGTSGSPGTEGPVGLTGGPGPTGENVSFTNRNETNLNLIYHICQSHINNINVLSLGCQRRRWTPRTIWSAGESGKHEIKIFQYTKTTIQQFKVNN